MRLNPWHTILSPCIGRRLAIAFLPLVLILIVGTMLAIQIIRHHLELGEVLEHSHRLIALPTLMAHAAVDLPERGAKNLLTQVDQFEQSIAYFTQLLNTETPASAARSTLAELQAEWRSFRRAVLHKNGVTPLTRADDKRVPALIATSERLCLQALPRLYDGGEHHWLLLLLLAALIFLVATWSAIRCAIRQPVTAIMTMARRFTAGDLTARIDYRANDEIGEMVQILNRTADTTQAMVNRLQQHQAELHLRERAMASTVDGIMISDARAPEHPTIYVNPAIERITGYAPDEVIGRNARFFLGDDLDQPAAEELRQLLREHKTGKVLLRCVTKDGRRWWNELSVAPVRDDAGIVTHTVSIFTDVSERKAQEEQLIRNAHQDALTGLATRALLGDRLNQAIASARRHHRRFGLLFVDIDNFKIINDSLGHGSGDALICIIARRLQACLREGDTAARLSSDEFVLLLTDLNNEHEIVSVGQRIRRLVAQAITLDHRELFVTASIGVSLYPRDGDDAATLLRNAEIAMHRAKEHGRNQLQVFTHEMQSCIVQRLSLETELRRALEREEFELYYQPKVCISTGQICGAEALIRWQHPHLGRVPPLDFIPLAEETGLIVPIGEWVIDTACAQSRAWLDAGLPVPKLGVNLSARQFHQNNLLGIILQSLRHNNVPPQLLELELTESMVMQDTSSAATILRQLKEVGLGLVLDDFGTGYSSLAYLRRLPVDVLKVDKSFIADVDTDPDDAAIAASVIALAHSLQLKVVAEGVETASQLIFLSRHRCDEIQGYYFSPPIKAEEFTALLRSGRRMTPPTLLQPGEGI